MRFSFLSLKKTRDYGKVFQIAHEIHDCAYQLLEEFNEKKIDLLNLPPHKRISLFFLTRALKTYSAIIILCQKGYTQDVSALIRSLLENLISLKYILRDAHSADQKTARFVDYKWVILKRYVSGTEANIEEDTIAQHVDVFKQKYSISSDKALVTWSGKSIRDMARSVDKDFLEEYDSTFRLCSRFSHPSIIGDKDFFTFENMTMTFSAAPSPSGNSTLITKAILYLLDFLRILDALFELSYTSNLDGIYKEVQAAFAKNAAAEAKNAKKNTGIVEKNAQKKIIVQFDTSFRR